MAATPLPDSPLPAVAAVGEPAQRTAIPSAARIASAIAGGTASWYSASGLQAAVPWWRVGQAPFRARVCAARCVVVTVTGWCECIGGSRLVDLSLPAFRELADPSRGLVRVSFEWLP